MLRNYLTITIRNLWHHRTTTAINLAGLAVSLAVCFLVALLTIGSQTFRAAPLGPVTTSRNE